MKTMSSKGLIVLRLSIIVLTLLGVASTAFTQQIWQPNGNDIYYNDGNVGIGTSSPNQKLSVNGTIEVPRENGAGLLFAGGTGGWRGLIWRHAYGNMAINSNTLALGTDSPISELFWDTFRDGAWAYCEKPVSSGYYVNCADYVGVMGPNDYFWVMKNGRNVKNPESYDLKILFDGESHDGVMGFMEDEDYFYYDDNVVFKDNVGIGITSPSMRLEVDGAILSSGGNSTVGNAAIGFKDRDSGTDSVTWFWYSSQNDARLWISDGTKDKLVVTKEGDVGIGLDYNTKPVEKLHVKGNGYITGELKVDGNIAAKYQDLAEYVRTSEILTTGTVVMIDADKIDQVVPSDEAYNTLVAGVVSPQPGIVLGVGGADKAMIAHTGRVKVKVDTSYGEIKTGDLLVTSPVKGFAMKADTDKLKPGMLLGKALEPLKDGQQGEVLTLITLQ
jgi:hypothetical protein